MHEKHLKDKLLFCEPLNARTAKEILNKWIHFFKEHHLKWKRVIVVCIDGAPAMLGCPSDFQTLEEEKSLDVIDTHCLIRR